MELTTTQAPCDFDSLSCSGSIPNPANCSCLVIPDCSGYIDLLSQYNSIKSWYESLHTKSPNIEDALAALKNLFIYLSDYCSTGPIISSNISAQYSVIQDLIATLQFNINEFKNTLKPNTTCKNPPACTNNYTLNSTTCGCECALICDTSSEIFDFGFCGCLNYSCAYQLYTLQKLITDAIQNASGQVMYSVAAAEYVEPLSDLYREFVALEGNIEYWSSSFPPGELCAELAELSAEYDNETTIYHQKIVNGNCSLTCQPNEILCIECYCTSSPEITELKTAYDLFVKNMSIIYAYSDFGNQTELQLIFSAVANASLWFNQVNTVISNKCSGLDTEYIKTQAQLLASATAAINASWTDFINEGNPCTSQALACTGVGNITDTGNCQCTFDECMASLPDVLSSLSTCVADINALICDNSTKQNLTNNW